MFSKVLFPWKGVGLGWDKIGDCIVKGDRVEYVFRTVQLRDRGAQNVSRRRLRRIWMHVGLISSHRNILRHQGSQEKHHGGISDGRTRNASDTGCNVAAIELHFFSDRDWYPSRVLFLHVHVLVYHCGNVFHVYRGGTHLHTDLLQPWTN